MTRTTDYDIEAADLVARTLRAVARDTDVAERPGEALPVAGLPAPIPLGAHRHRRTRRTVAATAAAAAVLLAALVWAGRNPSNPSDPAVTSDLGTVPPGLDVPTELVPDDTGGLTADREAVYTTSTGSTIQARIVLPGTGGRLLTAVVTAPEGGQSNADELSGIAQAVTGVLGGEGRAHTTATVGGRTGYLTMPLDDIDESVVTEVHSALVPEGGELGQDRLGDEWPTLPADISWVPGVASTVRRHYGDGGAATVDLSTTAGDIGPAMAMVAMLPDARPYPVGGAMGWQAPLADGRSLVVWQAAPGVVGTIVASEAASAGVGAMIESIPTAAPAPGEHPNARLVGQSAEGSDVPWVVERVDYISQVPERPCTGLWVAGQAPTTSCGDEIPSDDPFRSFGAVTQVDDDVTVVYGLLAPSVAVVATDAPGAEQATVETQLVDPDNPDGLRYAVLIIHGDRDVPQTFRLLGGGSEELWSAQLDLNEVGG